eukprot:symbB.v1.2.023357.t1/scaffold2133.1/size88229/2
MQQLRDFWKEGHLCDVVLKSIDGIEHPVHRNVLSAASAALKALLCAPFREAEQIRQGKPIEMAASGGVVGAFVDYIYGGEPDVATVDAVELLRLAGAYGLPRLAEVVQSDLKACLDSQLALPLLQQTVIWGLPDLRSACEEQVAKDFQQCTLREDFLKLTAKQLQRILQRKDLNVSREEVVVEALFKWAKFSEDRQRDMVLMLTHVDFPSLSSSNLHVLCHAAQSLGSSGADWECEVKEALSLHQKRPAGEVSRAHRPKRRCLSHWAAGLGACQESDRAGKKLTPIVKKCGYDLVWHKGAFLFSRIEPSQILSCKPGEENLRVLAGQGAPINGFNRMQDIRGLAMSPNGEMIVGHADEDGEDSQLLIFQDGVGKVLLNVQQLHDVCCSPNGVIYVLDAGGTRVQKVDGSRLMPIVDSKDLPEERAFDAQHVFVSKEEVLYISDYENDRILRFVEGTSVPTIVAEFGDRDGVDLGGLFVTEGERVFVCDRGDDQILMTDAGDQTSCSELDLSEHGSPQDLIVQDGFLNAHILNAIFQSHSLKYFDFELQRQDANMAHFENSSYLNVVEGMPFEEFNGCFVKRQQLGKDGIQLLRGLGGKQQILRRMRSKITSGMWPLARRWPKKPLRK